MLQNCRPSLQKLLHGFLFWILSPTLRSACSVNWLHTFWQVFFSPPTNIQAHSIPRLAGLWHKQDLYQLFERSPSQTVQVSFLCTTSVLGKGSITASPIHTLPNTHTYAHTRAFLHNNNVKSLYHEQGSMIRPILYILGPNNNKKYWFPIGMWNLKHSQDNFSPAICSECHDTQCGQ